MNLIENISDDANQLVQLVLPDASIVSLSLVYRPAIQRWTIDVSHPLLTVDEINVTTNPNMLRSFRRQIAWGIGCVTTDGADPVYLEDFADGRASLYLLDQADIDLMEATIFGVGG